jgi:VIT1/CCC1 family predicted Fe2+/Mn2+ transporter
VQCLSGLSVATSPGGIIDAIIYFMNCLSGRGREHVPSERCVRNAEEARQAISEALPEGVAAVLSPGELERLHVRLRALPEPPARPRLEGDDWLGAAGVFCLVFLSTLPVILPFLLLSEPALALRLSNLIAVCMLFLTGYIFGRRAGHRPLLLGCVMVLVGASLTGVAIALGG